jgi:TolB-like protein
MKMRTFLFVLLGAVFFAAGAGTAAARDNLAVLPFTGGEGGEGETIAELFSFSEELNAVFTPIPRTSISRAISSEQEFQTSTGMTDPDTIAAIGKQLGAQYIVAGNIAKLGSRNLLIISIMKIDDLRQIAGDVQAYGRIEEIQSKLPAMAQNIIAASRIDASKFEKLAVVPVELGGNINPQEADTLAQILSINLIHSGKYAVYPRTGTLEQVQTEYSTQMSGVTADENVADVGKGENPRYVLSVAARRLGSQNMFNAAIIDLESGAQVMGRSVNYERLDDGIEVMVRLASDLTGVEISSAIDFGAGEQAPVEQNWDDEIRSRAAASREPREGKKKPGGGAAFGYGVLNLALGLGSFIQKDVGGGVMTLLIYGAAGGLIGWELTLSYDDDLAGIPGTVGLGVAGLGALFGFIRPFIYQKNHTLAGVMDGIQMGVTPVKGGGAAVRLSYTMRF